MIGAAIAGLATLFMFRRAVYFFKCQDESVCLPDLKPVWHIISFVLPFITAWAVGHPVYICVIYIFLMFHSYTDHYTGNLYSVVSILYLAGYAVLFYKYYDFLYLDEVITAIFCCAILVILFRLLGAMNSGDCEMLFAFIPWVYLLELPWILKMDLFFLCSFTERIGLILLIPCVILLASFFSACAYGLLKREKRTAYAPHLLVGAETGILFLLLI